MKIKHEKLSAGFGHEKLSARIKHEKLSPGFGHEN